MSLQTYPGSSNRFDRSSWANSKEAPARKGVVENLGKEYDNAYAKPLPILELE